MHIRIIADYFRVLKILSHFLSFPTALPEQFFPTILTDRSFRAPFPAFFAGTLSNFLSGHFFRLLFPTIFPASLSVFSFRPLTRPREWLLSEILQRPFSIVRNAD
jgi:hypothetical protein